MSLEIFWRITGNWLAIIRQNFFSSVYVQACCHELWTARRRCQRRFVYFIYLAAFKSKDILVVEGETKLEHQYYFSNDARVFALKICQISVNGAFVIWSFFSHKLTNIAAFSTLFCYYFASYIKFFKSTYLLAGYIWFHKKMYVGTYIPTHGICNFWMNYNYHLSSPIIN